MTWYGRNGAPCSQAQYRAESYPETPEERNLQSSWVHWLTLGYSIGIEAYSIRRELASRYVVRGAFEDRGELIERANKVLLEVSK